MATVNIINGILANQPSNLNFLSPLGFRFTLRRSPSVNFFCTDANIPSFELGFINQPTPFSNIKIPGDKPEWGSFRLTFKVDEDFVNYLEIYNWILKLGFPNNFEQYASIVSQSPGSGQGTVSDGTLTILNSSQHPNMEVIFHDMFPISISDTNFTTTDTTVDYVTATVEFKYTYLTFNKL
jgi:hypothetical protein